MSVQLSHGERVLQDFGFHVRAGEKLGLVGRSGAGKSTVLALLQRLYDPDRGHVLIDEQDIAKVTQESLRRTIAVVQQEISLFHRSVLENALRPARGQRCGGLRRRRGGPLHRIHRAPAAGFATIVGERGLKLSGGERQRLAIARAFLRDAPIILLDEATSALDTESEQAIQEALARLLIGGPSSPSPIGFDPQRLRPDHGHRGGRVIEEGSPAELLRREGVYCRMHAGS